MLVDMYFSSIELRIIDVCFLMSQATTIDPKLKQHPKVLLSSIVLPAQFVLV